MSEDLVCPILVASAAIVAILLQTEVNNICIKQKCAWWSESGKACFITIGWNKR